MNPARLDAMTRALVNSGAFYRGVEAEMAYLRFEKVENKILDEDVVKAVERAASGVVSSAYRIVLAIDAKAEEVCDAKT